MTTKTSYMPSPPKRMGVIEVDTAVRFTVGQGVYATKPLGDFPSEDSPGGLYADKGEHLIVRKIEASGEYPISVSHPSVVDKTFGVKPNEITAHPFRPTW